MLAEAALLPAPEVVGDAERRDGQDARAARSPRPSRRVGAAGRGGSGPAGRRRGRCREAGGRGARSRARSRPVARCSSCELGLADRELRVRGVRGHRRLAAEAGREREDGVTRLLRQTSLARERLARRVAGRELDQPPRRFLRDPEAAALPAREGRDRQVAVAGEQRRQIAAKVGVAEQDRAGRRGALGQRQRLPLPAVREPEHPGAGCRRDRRRSRRGTRRRRRSPPRPGTAASAQRLSSRSAPPRPVPRPGSSGAQPPVGAGSGSIGGRIPSSAVSRMP